MTIYYKSVLIILDGLAERSCTALCFVLTLRICLKLLEEAQENLLKINIQSSNGEDFLRINEVEK
jgi:hypothetical protein